MQHSRYQHLLFKTGIKYYCDNMQRNCCQQNIKGRMVNRIHGVAGGVGHGIVIRAVIDNIVADK